MRLLTAGAVITEMTAILARESLPFAELLTNLERSPNMPVSRVGQRLRSFEPGSARAGLESRTLPDSHLAKTKPVESDPN